MIVGHGDMASALTESGIDRDDVNFFASGVSDSSCSDPKKFNREFDLLREMPRQVHLVYFSTLSIYYGHSPYIAHKKKMEQWVRISFDSYTICRMGNINWGSNPNTLINYLTDRIKNNRPFNIQQTYRYIIDKEEFIHWMKMILVREKNEMNLTGVRWWVPDLVEKIKKEIYATISSNT